jgi:hypothetical protein
MKIPNDDKQKVLNMTVEDFRKTADVIREDERHKTINKTVADYSSVVAMVLHDKWGFQRPSILKFLEDVNYLFDSILTGYTDIADIKKALYDELEIKISNDHSEKKV